MSPDDVYVIAVKRERRHDVPRDWLETVRGTPGVTVLGESSPLRIQVRASPDAIKQVESRLSNCLHIEKLVPHERL